MELGGIAEFRYVPEWNGNREAPDDERLSLTVKRVKAAQILNDDTDADIERWRDTRNISKAARDTLLQMPISVLRNIRVCVNHTKDLQGFLFDGEEVTDPLEAFCRLNFGADDLLLEILSTINKTATMSEDELGNFASLSDGSATPTTESATGAVEGDNQANADTTEVATGT